MQRQVPLLNGSSRQIAAALQEEIRRMEGARPVARDDAPLSAGCAALDRLLPDGGLRRGWLTEWLGVEGGGAGTLALIAAREACLDGGALVVMDRGRRFYPPAAAALGIDLEATIVVRPQNLKDELWALDQALRCGGVAAVWAPLESVDDRTFRRLQLAAEEGGGVGFLVRPATLRNHPTWSDVQFWVEPKASGRHEPADGAGTVRSLEGPAWRSESGGLRPPLALSPASGRREPADGAGTVRSLEGPAWRSESGGLRPPLALASGAGSRRFRIEVARCRGGPAGGAVDVEFDEVTGALRPAVPYEETHPVLVAPSLADSAAHRRPTTA
jgi:protein ImuA